MANRDVHAPKLPGVRTLKDDAVTEADDAEHLGVSFNTKSKAVPLTTPKPTQPVAGEGRAGDKALFDVGRAIDDGQLEVGSFVTDKQHKKIAFREVSRAAFSEWWGKMVRTIKKIEAFAPVEEKPTIPKAETRKEIIKEATAHTRLAPRDDHELVVEKIKTFAHDAERVTGKSYTIKNPSVAIGSAPSWKQLSDNAPNQKQSATEPLASTVVPAPSSSQPSKRPDHLTIAPVVVKPARAVASNTTNSTPTPTTLPQSKSLVEPPKPHDDMTVIRAPRSEPQLIATPAAPYVERPHKPGLWKILTQKKGVEHVKVTVAPPIPKPLSRLTLSESQTGSKNVDINADQFLALFQKRQANKPTQTSTTEADHPTERSTALTTENVVLPPPTAKSKLQTYDRPPEIKPLLAKTPPESTEPALAPSKPEVISQPETQPGVPKKAEAHPETIPKPTGVTTPLRATPPLLKPPLETVKTVTVPTDNEPSEWTDAARENAQPVILVPEHPVATPPPTSGPAEVAVPPPPTPIIRVKTPPPASDKPTPAPPRLVLTGDKPYFEFQSETPPAEAIPAAHITRAFSATPKTAKPVWTTNRLTFVMVLVILVVVGVGAGIYTGLRHSAKEASELFSEPAEVSGFFTTDRSVAVPISSSADELSRTIRVEIVTAPAGITHIYGVTTNEKTRRQIAVSTDVFVKSLGWRLDSRFLRALEETMMIGSIQNEPYIILRSSNFDLAFAGMLGWESAMAADLAVIFEITPLPAEGPFTDVLTQNRTLRVRSDAEGNESIVYTFLDRRTIVIASNQAALFTIIAAIN